MPSLFALRVVYFDFIDPVDYLYQGSLAVGLLVEHLEIQFFPLFEKKCGPAHVKQCPDEKNKEYGKIVIRQDNIENDECDD
jgi:hypothetical protein